MSAQKTQKPVWNAALHPINLHGVLAFGLEKNIFQLVCVWSNFYQIDLN